MKDANLGSENRLTRLKRHVIEPIMLEIERNFGVRYVVRTPYDLGLTPSGKIMRDVIHAIDRADIVIADLTGSNPNVFYELGITHALGRPCVAVLEQKQKKVEFDLSDYRVYRINLDDNQYIDAERMLRDVLFLTHGNITDWSKLENPVIDHFRAPITYISPAFSLASNYFHNFVKPVVESIYKRNKGGYLYDIGVAETLTQTRGQMEDFKTIDADRRPAVKLNLIIPTRIYLSRHLFADRLAQTLYAARVEHDGRHYTCFAQNEAGRTQLIDIPTAIRGIEDAVNRRTRYHDPNETEWREIEEQEIERFILVLQTFINSHEDKPLFAEAVQIVRYDPDRPADSLFWLHTLLRGKS